MSVLTTVLLAAEEFEAHHWWWPETKEIIWGGLAFLIVAVGIWKFGGPAIKQGMANRSKRVADELAKAESARSSAEAEAAALKASLRDAGADGAKLLADADAAAAAMLQQGRVQLDQDVAELATRAETDIAAGTSRATGELQVEVGRMAAEAAERIVARSLDQGLQVDLVEQYIAKVGASA